MRSLTAFAILLITASVAGSARAEVLPAGASSLVVSERAFAEMSVAQSMRTAFLANLANDAVLFNPGPVNGYELYQSRPESPGVLSWEPTYAEIALSQNFGFTTGPWEMRPDAKSDPVAFGHFVSVWKRSDTGPWKVAVDVGISHDPLDETPELVVRQDEVLFGPLDDAGVLAAREALLEADRAYILASARGAAAAVTKYGAEDMRCYRDGMEPVWGRDAVTEMSGALGNTTSMVPTGADIAKTGDLGYTMGTRGTPVSAYYVRIWRVDDNRVWKLVLDVESEVPAQDG
jgi:ketosteroid isomerase-like protein